LRDAGEGYESVFEYEYEYEYEYEHEGPWATGLSR
jgi:hypothetical protein